MDSRLGPTTAIRRGHEIDRAALERYLTEHLEGFAGPLEIRQFEGGQSNPTFQLRAASGDYVLRKKPPGQLLVSAHAVDREYRVMTALAETDVPVPVTLLMCDDASVIGTPFFIMDCVNGRIFRQPHLPGVSASDRARMYEQMASVLATLHCVDAASIGLGDYGRPGNYFARQTARWTQQYLSARTENIEAMDRLAAWLSANIPSDNGAAIVHGDYRIENLIFHSTRPQIVAVVDWELSTLGHPLADLAYNCLTYYLPAEALGLVEQGDDDRAGMPSEAEYVAMYCRFTGRESIPDWNYYLAFSMFRLASILQGVYARGLHGNAASTHALERGAAAKTIADIAWELVTP